MSLLDLIEEELKYKDTRIFYHKNGEIIELGDSVFKIKLYSNPEKLMFTTSIERAFRILTYEVSPIKNRR
ncbi:unnamed protein product [marine sediment metagenome]|uniref:Uncharacterized protein n=1 Tax=marine sediment metagenome TaxID=412755 RepID=X1AMR9_9ZZZZ